jgi:hypothetical protein
VVRRQTANLLFVGSIPTGASIVSGVSGRVLRHLLASL